MMWRFLRAIIPLSLFLWVRCTDLQTEDVKQNNLVFIMFDDLRPELSFYGRRHMITPNFERLASKSVIFDHAYCQVAVCNPSRASLLTGLRPDTTKSYNFEMGYEPHLPFPSQLAQTGYNTAGFGKIAHWEFDDRRVWNFDSWNDQWYAYQNAEERLMNSSVMPDRTRREEDFKDHAFTSRAIATMRNMSSQSKYFMLGIGFKLPHLALHIPHRYFKMYEDKKKHWALTPKELKYPPSLSEISYRCCAERSFRFMNAEGTARFERSVSIGDINETLPQEMHDELMMGYSAAVSYLDTQVGRILDVLDELHLWENTTVVLTSDHGMHNGEKGIWEKWSLFEESTRVPLLIAHPQSPFKGQHYTPPVELIDVYPTLVDLLRLPVARTDACVNYVCKALEGKSLAPVVLSQQLFESLPNPVTKGGAVAWLSKRFQHRGKALMGPKHEKSAPLVMPMLGRTFAVSQVLRCAPLDRIPPSTSALLAKRREQAKNNITVPTLDEYRVQNRVNQLWSNCVLRSKKEEQAREMSLLGYSMRTHDYRYTAYFPYDRATQRPSIDHTHTPPYEEELFDHRNETLADFTHRETVNLAYRASHVHVVEKLRKKLKEFIRHRLKLKPST